MTQPEVVAAAKELIAAPTPFVLSTVDGEGRPQSRWMGGLVLEEPFTIWMAAGAGSRKMDQVSAHPQAQLLFQTPDFSRVITVSGHCEILDSAAVKQQLWAQMPALARYFSGPEDPHLGVLRFEAKRVELLMIQDQGREPLVAEL